MMIRFNTIEERKKVTAWLEKQVPHPVVTQLLNAAGKALCDEEAMQSILQAEKVQDEAVDD